jgi:hypothetical protein
MSYFQLAEGNLPLNEHRAWHTGPSGIGLAGWREKARAHGLGWFAEQPGQPAPAPPQPHPAIAALCLSHPRTQATVDNALAIVRLISRFHGIPWRLPFVVLEHEGGVRLFTHNDGVMQTIDTAKEATIRAMPRELKLGIVGRAHNDAIAIAALNTEVRQQFPSRLAVQIACGIQEIKTGLDRFAGYVALALIAYNAGVGSAARVVTRGAATARPPNTTDAQWEEMCRTAATLYHQFPGDVRIANGQWQCDANIPTWFRNFPVFDRPSGLQLIAYQYLRQINTCIRVTPPTIPCVRAVHGQRQDGTGALACSLTRFGALDKLYHPARLSAPYRDALMAVLGPVLGPISDDRLPIQVQNGRMIKLAIGAGPAVPQGSLFDGMP